MKEERPCKIPSCLLKRFANQSLCWKHYREHEKKKREEKATRKLLRKTASKGFQKSERTRLKNRLWELCKQIIRLKYGPICYTCGRPIKKKSDWHTGHFIPSSTCGLYLRYDLRNLRPQNYHCNINLGGNGAIFCKLMVEREGQEYVDQIFRDQQKITPESNEWYKAKIEEYTRILKELQP